MFSFFNKKSHINSLEWLGVDVHSHLLPGIDDGSPDVDTSIRLISNLNKLGFRKFICTPHIFTELYPNTLETITGSLNCLREEMQAVKLDVEISAAAEHMVDESFVVKNDLLALPGNYILIEMSYLTEMMTIEQVIFDLQIKGYQVILAHPERYNFYHKSYQRFQRYKDMGVLFQLNLLSVTGYYGKEVKRAAEYLISQKFYDLAATDLHNDKHLHALTHCVETGFIYKKLGNYSFRNLELFG